MESPHRTLGRFSHFIIIILFHLCTVNINDSINQLTDRQEKLIGVWDQRWGIMIVIAFALWGIVRLCEGYPFART